MAGKKRNKRRYTPKRDKSGRFAKATKIETKSPKKVAGSKQKSSRRSPKKNTIRDRISDIVRIAANQVDGTHRTTVDSEGNVTAQIIVRNTGDLADARELLLDLEDSADWYKEDYWASVGLTVYASDKGQSGDLRPGSNEIWEQPMRSRIIQDAFFVARHDMLGGIERSLGPLADIAEIKLRIWWRKDNKQPKRPGER